MSSSSSVTLTPNAAQKVYELIQEEGNPNLKLRAYIQGGGCSGFQYGFTFEEVVKQGDKVFTTPVHSISKAEKESEGGSVDLLINWASFAYLKGAEIDYQEGIGGSRFIIRNPNAKTTCGCGSSFSVE